jgi:hypothetical protein
VNFPTEGSAECSKQISPARHSLRNPAAAAAAAADPAGAPGIEAGYHVVVAPLETAALALSPPAGTRLRVVLSDSPAPDPAEEVVAPLSASGLSVCLFAASRLSLVHPHPPPPFRACFPPPLDCPLYSNLPRLNPPTPASAAASASEPTKPPPPSLWLP